MALIDHSKDIAGYIEDQKQYLGRNAQLFDIYEGNLKPYVDQILRESLSEQYYSKIRNRIIPINILKRLIDKLARSYSEKPARTASSDQEILEMYEVMLMINKKLNIADEFSQLFRGYALEPYIVNNRPKLRVIPFDRFLVKSKNIMDPMTMTHFMRYVGKKNVMVKGRRKDIDVWFVYTDDEFMAISQDGDILSEFMVENDGINPYGFIPFYYGNRSEHKLLPTQDTDILELSKLLPVQLTDLAGAIMFQCFSIVYGIDVDSENMVMSPNAFWNMKSDPQSDKSPQIGTIKPQADIDKVMAFIKDTFTTWLETRGIRVGSLGSADAASFSSGISKIIDEMDTFETIKRSQEAFKYDEYKFWQLIKDMHNKWIEFGELKGVKTLPDNWEVFTEFDEPSPLVDRNVELDLVMKQIEGGLISRRTGLKMLYPDWTDDDINTELNSLEDEFIGKTSNNFTGE